MAARAVLPEAPARSRRTRSNREVAKSASAVGVCDVSTLGKIDVQGSGRRHLPRPGLCQHLLDAAGRQGALRADAARGRLRARRRHHGAAGRGPLFHDHHHRQRGQGDAASRVLPAVSLARARRADGLGHRAMGAICRWPARAPATCCRRSSIRPTICPTRRFPISPAATSRCAAASPGRLFRLSFSGELAYEIGVPARFGDALVRRDHGGRRGVRHRALRHRGARRDAHREGPSGRQRAERPDHGARSRLRQDAVGQEGLHRPLHGGASGADRSGAAEAGGLAAARPRRPHSRRRASHAQGRGADRRERPGLCHLDRVLAVARPLARARAARPRARAARRDRARFRSRARTATFWSRCGRLASSIRKGERLRV